MIMSLKKSVSMEEAVDAIRDIFESNELKYVYDEEESKFKAIFGRSDSPLGTMTLVVYLKESSREPGTCIRITSRCFVGFNAPVKRRAEIAEYLHRANYGLVYGHFEMDYDDGEVLFKMSVNTVDGLPGLDALDDLCNLPLLMMNRYADGMLEVSMGMYKPLEAIKKIEDEDD